MTALPGTASLVVPVSDPSGVGEVRRAAEALSARWGLQDAHRGQAALVATEMATNLVKHAGHGQILLRGLLQAERPAIELLALDRGPGIPNLAQSLKDGTSTRGTPGTGLGAIRRASTAFDVFSSSQGTAVLARVGGEPSEPAQGWDWGAVAVAKAGETVPGDSWAVAEGEGVVRLLVADGLGHGPDAATAAEAARSTFLERAGRSLTALLEDCHRAMRPTRGAAVAVAEVDRVRREVRYAGVGNIAATLWSPAGTRSLVSLNGTLGHGHVRLREFSYPWMPQSLLILASDGLRTHWALDAYAGLAARSPALVAGVLYRDQSRGSDDVTVVALRDHTGGAP
jgi:anti-sigma regulatory factor (Ser/Thr protein kinase)